MIQASAVVQVKFRGEGRGGEERKGVRGREERRGYREERREGYVC